jgi:hypothetical protein
MFLATPEKLAIRNALVQLFLDVPIGQTLMHAEITSVSRGYRHLVDGALKVIEKSHGALFENVRGIGYKRMEATRLPTIGERARQAIGRKARVAARRLVNGTSRANDLDRHTQMRITQELGVLGVLREMAKAEG